MIYKVRCKANVTLSFITDKDAEIDAKEIEQKDIIRSLRAVDKKLNKMDPIDISDIIPGVRVRIKVSMGSISYKVHRKEGGGE